MRSDRAGSQQITSVAAQAAEKDATQGHYKAEQFAAAQAAEKSLSSCSQNRRMFAAAQAAEKQIIGRSEGRSAVRRRTGG